MGHLLSSINPEAAAAIKPEEPVVADLPHVGSIVSYFPRPGEGRGGRGEFAMFVTGVGANGTLTGIVFFDAQDLLDVARLPRRTETHRWPAWDWVEEKSNADIEILAADISTMYDNFKELRQRLVVVESNELIVAKIESMQVALSDLETRTIRLQHLQREMGSPIIGRLDALEQQAGASVHLERALEAVAAVNAANRLDTLERDIYRVKESALTDIEARLDALEDRPKAVAPVHPTQPKYPPPLKYELTKPPPKAKRKKKRKLVKRPPPIPPASD